MNGTHEPRYNEDFGFELGRIVGPELGQAAKDFVRVSVKDLMDLNMVNGAHPSANVTLTRFLDGIDSGPDGIAAAPIDRSK